MEQMIVHINVYNTVMKLKINIFIITQKIGV